MPRVDLCGWADGKEHRTVEDLLALAEDAPHPYIANMLTHLATTLETAEPGSELRTPQGFLAGVREDLPDGTPAVRLTMEDGTNG